jgi:hypothetical protein
VHRIPTKVVQFPQQLGSLLNGPVFDPNTGIIAGFLNARDDLATSVLTANKRIDQPRRSFGRVAV